MPFRFFFLSKKVDQKADLPASNDIDMYLFPKNGRPEICRISEIETTYFIRGGLALWIMSSISIFLL